MESTQTYLCTRPTLASHLIALGFEYQITENPFNRDGKHPTAWLFKGDNIADAVKIWKQKNTNTDQEESK